MRRALHLLQHVRPTIVPEGLVSRPHSQSPLVVSRHNHSAPQSAPAPVSFPIPPQNSVSTKVQLRPYQEESIASVLEYLSRGETRLGISLATGSGKTVIFSHLISRVPSPTPLATRTLILAHRRELVEQAANHCRKLYGSSLNVEIEMGNLHGSGKADITIASVQSLVSGDRLAKYDPERFKLVLVDEAHHIVAPRYMDVLRHFGLVGERKGLGKAALVGFSATFSRLDGIMLGAAIDHIVYHKDYVAMIEDDWLSNAVFTTVETKADLSKVKTSNGDFLPGSLSKAINNDETNIITVRSWLQKAGTRKSTLVFCIDLAHVRSLTDNFRQHGIDARFVTSQTPTALRAEILEDFKAGKFQVLLNCGIFTEGTDIPNVDCIVLSRPTQSQNLLVQMIGRGLRKSPGKENCHIIDMVSSLKTGIVNTPTLFGLDPATLVEYADTTEMKSRRERVKLEQEASNGEAANVKLNSKVTFTDYDTVNALIEDTSGERHIRAVSRFGWVQIDDDRYILSNRDGDYLTLKREQDDRNHLVLYTRKLPEITKTPFARPVVVASAATFTGAVNAADKFASEIFPFDLISKNASWRRSAASQGQVDYLNKFREEGNKLEVESITKGRAADWITKIKFGARGRFSRIQQQQRKVERLEDKQEKWTNRQRQTRIDVGPVKW